MKNNKCKLTSVNCKVDSDVFSVNPCVSLQLDLFNDVVESQLIALYNCINVTLRHTDSVLLDGYATKFIRFVTSRFALVVLQKCGLFERRYTVVTNKDMLHIHSILFDFEHTTLNDNDFSMQF